MGDTLTIVSDDSRYFNNNIYSIATKKRAREIYRGYRLDFDEEIPIRFCATSLSDTIIYEKTPIKSASYQLSKGILRSELAIGMVIDVYKRQAYCLCLYAPAETQSGAQTI